MTASPVAVVQRPVSKSGHGPTLSPPTGAPSIGKKATIYKHVSQSSMVWLFERLKGVFVVVSFLTCAACLHIQQFFGLPLYWSSRLYRSWQDAVKSSTAVLLIGLNQWRAPTTAEISWDESVKGQIKWTSNGKIEFDAPDRMVLIANHQIYTDWIYLWWSAYTARHHGHLIVILKDALKKIPIVGPGLVFFNWIFLSRKWETDEVEMQRSLGRLAQDRVPMWLLLFPEGTNLTARSRSMSKKWADKVGTKDFDLTLIPRSRGLQFCLRELASTLDWLYDCTIAYDGIPPGVDSQDVWNLPNLYFEGRKAPTAHMHWRRFAVSSIPFEDSDAFDKWLYERWAEKEQLLQHHQRTGKFPSSGAPMLAKIELWNFVEMLQVCVSFFAALALWLVVRVLYRALPL
ncbi:hypothetical protein CKM354_000814100 [Cercospora kikuchii]|uniref:Phospholipid/glycerol acyltransferase domain-containing protein n=1 Tax=Cercospora kikuchii TaxID=84275 RepID=A0A9P3FI40_9PEZI|nr:uncharacterized protein CKM354_000814100 [Cercospora kikuchii]GIZ44957.1 hypothetical protein CKM354_000814100 [Cercospora kikuchii]